LYVVANIFVGTGITRLLCDDKDAFWHPDRDAKLCSKANHTDYLSHLGEVKIPSIKNIS